MTEESFNERQDRDLVLYMDVLGHDILNNNQAVQGYLELILASPGAGERERAYAEKAVSHIRSSTFLLENIRKIAVASKKGNLGVPRPVDLSRAVEQARSELTKLFPGKRMSFKADLRAPRPVTSESLLVSIVMNLMVDMVRLDEGSDVSVRVSSEELTEGTEKWCRVTVENPMVAMPTVLTKEVTDALESPDKSKIVRVTGILFTAIIASRLGWEFKLVGEAGRPGCRVELTLLEGVA